MSEENSVKNAYVQYFDINRKVAVPINWIKKFNPVNEKDFDRYQLYRIKISEQIHEYTSGNILMLGGKCNIS